MWDEITDPVPNFIGTIYEWISIYISHFTGPCWDLKQSMLSKGASEDV